MGLSHQGSLCLDEINAFDLAEASDVYFGQINVVGVTSFCGPGGFIWGYDLAKADDLEGRGSTGRVASSTGNDILVYSADPLLAASRALFGTIEDKRFPLLPGSLVPCAIRSVLKPGPATLYCGIAMGIPERRERDAVLWMEDVGFLEVEESEGTTRERALGRVGALLAESVGRVGRNQHVDYTAAYVSVRAIAVEAGKLGCAVVVVPYFCLAFRAIPSGGPQALLNVRLSEWESAMGFRDRS